MILLLKILIGILIWFAIEISMALAVSIGLTVFFERQKEKKDEVSK